MRIETDTSPQMQQFVEQLANRHDLNPYAQKSQLWVHHPERNEWLLISNIDGERIAVAHCRVIDRCLYPDLDMVFLLDNSDAWFPTEVCYTDAVWDGYVFQVEVVGELQVEDEEGQLILHRFTEFHAAQWQAQGWLDQGRRFDLTVEPYMIGGADDSGR